MLVPICPQLLGSMFSDPQHLRHATMVCKQWRSNLAAGVQELHMDMPPDTEAWLSRVQRLGSLLPKLGRCRAHISSAVPVAALASNLKVLGEELEHIEVSTRVAQEPLDALVLLKQQLGGIAVPWIVDCQAHAQPPWCLLARPSLVWQGHRDIVQLANAQRVLPEQITSSGLYVSRATLHVPAPPSAWSAVPAPY